jgi:hypothetical protein
LAFVKQLDRLVHRRLVHARAAVGVEGLAGAEERGEEPGWRPLSVCARMGRGARGRVRTGS